MNFSNRTEFAGPNRMITGTRHKDAFYVTENTRGHNMTIEMALKELVPGLQSIYGNLIDSIVLYGSTARGTQTDESDVDVAILLHAGATKEMRDRMLDLVVDLELACGKVLSVLCIDYEKFTEWKDTLPFYQNIRKDGVVLWQAA